MNQKKTGEFLKQLRKEKGITQEQLAERFYVSGRTVSRWETGSNLPDLSILVELADYYDVDIREIIDGERKSENMNNETKETLMKVAEYTNEDKNELKKRMANIQLGAGILLVFSLVLSATNGFGGLIPERPCSNMMDFTEGLCISVLLMNVLYLHGILDKIREKKLAIFKREK